MGYEVDYLVVGDGESSGDCIVLRYGDLMSGDPSQQQVIVIDGGYQKSGEALVDLIQGTYGTNRVDLVISTHFDKDHISGLIPVFEKLTVGALMMHKPWDHTSSSQSSQVNQLSQVRKSCEQASSLEQLAVNQRVPIVEPFAGLNLSISPTASMHVLGPTQVYYEELLTSFEFNKSETQKVLDSLRHIATQAGEVLKKIQETLDPSTETLDHTHKNTSAENNSSAIILFNLDGNYILFTGDAGVDALHRAIDFAEQAGIPTSSLRLLDVPHHGSKHNIDSHFLSRVSAKSAFISAAKESKKHPSPRVTNALLRRDMKIAVTQSTNLRHHNNAPDRLGYSAVEQYPFIEDFEDDD